MKTVFYASRMDDDGGNLLAMIHGEFPEIKIEICDSIDGLSSILRQPMHRVSAVILKVLSNEELVALTAMLPLFDNIRVILILSDPDENAHELCFKLKPSFVGDGDTDLKDVLSVLGQIKKITKETPHDMDITMASTAKKEAEAMAKSTEIMGQAVELMADKAGKYLTFSMAKEEYGIGILKIKEIIGMMPITTVPQTPEFVKGVINLRGKVIPVIDLRARFGMNAKDYTDRTCIIVVEIGGKIGTIQIGIVVDSVSEVLNIKAEDMEATPTFGTRLNTDYILGMAKMQGGVKILLDIDRVLSIDEIVQVEKAA